MEQEGRQDADRVADSRWKTDAPCLKMGNFVLKMDFDEGDEYFREKARDELRETPEIVEQSLNDFRTMVKAESNLVVPDDDEFYKKFLRPCKWYPKSSFELMKRFYKFKLNNPRYSRDLLPSNEQKVLCSDIAIPLPDRTADGCKMILINAGKQWNPKLITSDEILRTTMLLIEIAINEPKTQICGIHTIINMAGFSLSHVTHITPSFAAAMTEWIQRCLPCRIKGIHIVNQPFIFKMVYAIFKPFLLEKTRKRLHFHGTDREALISFLGVKNLPIEFGGELEMPNEPIGRNIYEYVRNKFEKKFEETNKFGYIVNEK
ncbi:alpha-tocopherol transfer protein isoform X1 [Apis mellifera caucasica]|uniref:Alpha-tocopherol transfer protein isoform X1 n=1 Tax=Apis mellifera TaxID=7460 RepID=A0A7M7FZI2_APIME|nr:alpha-tocopherol transfer protein isoform X1 [Apis mellifera]XP_016770214.1 alpha-tocopherol transfer protein isoform X1 [Apis mellifera]KAG6798242.1 alpha-tocopherol transfer protein isoform X1 [Apis mellifera caucasica]KAG9435993.1 alpha-tocopherol transfer protein isoform X1 [Apis mellifera carnica]|eukprot:XP_001122721.2 alpha-tocopherol transfer protein isoform X1 [Apis mellifera]